MAGLESSRDYLYFPQFFIDHPQTSQEYIKPWGTRVPRWAKHLTLAFILRQQGQS